MRGITLITIILALVALGVLSGCGGGAAGLTPGGTVKGTGGATVTIKWPTRGRLIPLASNSIKVEISDGQGFTTSQIADRPQDGSNSTVHFDNLPAAWVRVYAYAYPQVGGQGVVQAYGYYDTYIPADGTANVTMTMDSTITRVDLFGQLTIPVGSTSTLIPQAKNSMAEIVIVPSDGYTWESADPTIATVDLTTGVVTGVKAGTVTITARDKESYVAGSVLVVITDPDNPITWVSGDIHTAQTWSGTVRLTGDVRIGEFGSVTITPGTQVLADPRSDDQFGGNNPSRIELIVNAEGTLIAEGTAENPITFTSAAAINPTAGDWEGIIATGGTTSLSFCTLTYGRTNLILQGGTITIADCTSQQCADYSLWLQCKNPDNMPVEFVRTTFRDRAAYTSSVDDVKFTDCAFLNSNGSGAQTQNATFTNCVAKNNAGWGIYTDYNATLTNCTVNDNGSGVYGYSVTLDGCTLLRNRDWASYHVVSAVNTVVAFSTYGLRLRGWDASPVVDNCLVYGNQYGVGLWDSSNVVHITGASDIFGNVNYDFFNQCGSSVSYDGISYWGDQTRDELAAHLSNLTRVYDSRDNGGVGQVAIHAWADNRVTTHVIPSRKR